MGVRNGNFMGFDSRGRVRMGAWFNGKKHGNFTDTSLDGTVTIT
jgi:hypothetical protein